MMENIDREGYGEFNEDGELVAHKSPYRTPEEKAADDIAFREFRKQRWDALSWQEKVKQKCQGTYLMYKFRWQDFWRSLRKK